MRSRIALESPLFVPEIRRWLRVVCLQCGTPVVSLQKYSKIGPSRRLVEASKASTEGARCPSCRAVHPKIVKADDDYFTFEAHHPAAGKHGAPRVTKLYPDTIRAAFERVTSATTEAFGRPYHPSALVVRNVLIPPNTIRPGVRMGFGPAGASSHHDLTNMVQYLVKRNLMLPEEILSPMSRENDRLIQNAQQLYYDMILGGASTAAANGSAGRRGIVVGGRSVRSILRTFAQKEGRIRKHLLGKRVWLISRSTISGNPQLRIDEVGYPIAFARTTQVEETVQEFNRDRLMVYFLNGDKQYPGCSRVIKRATGAVHRVSGLRRDFQLEIGDKIERDVITGDFGFFNRAPSLERSSIGVHRIVILEDPAIHTFQMNVAACAWYNADFDGDQMNLWIPHTIMSRVEAEFMSSVANWFISTKTSGPSLARSGLERRQLRADPLGDGHGQVPRDGPLRRDPRRTPRLQRRRAGDPLLGLGGRQPPVPLTPSTSATRRAGTRRPWSPTSTTTPRKPGRSSSAGASSRASSTRAASAPAPAGSST